MISKYTIVFLLLSTFGLDVESYKILILCPLQTKSHTILGKGIADILYDAKHEVTFITSFPSKNPKYRELSFTIDESTLSTSMPTFQSVSTGSKLDLVKKLPTMINKITEAMFESENIQEFLNNKEEKFDLVIVQYFLNHALTGFGVKFDCPVIMLSPAPTFMHWLARLNGNPISPATIPNAFTGYSGEMTLSQRFVNTMLAIFQEGFGWFYADELQRSVYEKYLPNEAAIMPFHKLHEKIALTFSSSHPSMGSVRPFLPNVIEIGGYFVNENTALSEEYQKMLDNAKNGVIFFSMGSNLKSAEMPDQLKSDILAALGKRKETILWKYEEDLPQKPKNVIIRSWMPQASILRHPNVELFITHGGMLSTTEATAAGVPVLSIPIYGDQFMNAKMTQDRGCGVLLAYSNLTEKSLTWALNEVIGNPIYTETAKKSYQLYHDRPLTPKQLVAFYAEHVIRTGGAKHLSPPHLPLYSLFLLDVMAVLALPLILLLVIILWLCSKCCLKSSQVKTKRD